MVVICIVIFMRPCINHLYLLHLIYILSSYISISNLAYLKKNILYLILSSSFLFRSHMFFFIPIKALMHLIENGFKLVSEPNSHLFNLKSASIQLCALYFCFCFYFCSVDFCKKLFN